MADRRGGPRADRGARVAADRLTARLDPDRLRRARAYRAFTLRTGLAATATDVVVMAALYAAGAGTAARDSCPPGPACTYVVVATFTAADAFGARHTSRDAMARALVRLADQNLADPEPPKWEELWFYSHPAIAGRVRALGLRWEDYAG